MGPLSNPTRWATLPSLLALLACGPDRIASPEQPREADTADEAVVVSAATDVYTISVAAEENPAGLLAPGPGAPAGTTTLNPAAAPTGTFPLVFVRAEADASGNAGAPVVDNLADAIARVRPDGTIRVFDGIFPTENVVVDRPVTIEAAPRAAPMIATGGVDAVGLFISDVPTGRVTLRGLTFDLAARSAISVFARSEYDRVLIENCRFDVETVFDRATSQGEQAVGVEVSGSTVAGRGRVEVRGSTFRGGSAGVFAVRGGRMDVLDSDFAGFWFSGIQYQWSATGRVEGNTVTDCGLVGCIRAPGAGRVEIVENHLSNHNAREVRYGIIAFTHWDDPDTRALLKPDVLIEGNDVLGSGGSDVDPAFDLEGIVVSEGQSTIRGNVVSDARTGIQLQAATGTIEANELTACGACIIADRDGTSVLGNTMTVDASRRSENAITARRDVEVRGNLVEGVGGTRDPRDESTWPVGNAMLIEFTSTATVSENTIRGSWRGINVEGANGHVSGLDNLVEESNTGLQVVDVEALDLHSSDFTGYTGIFIGDEDVDVTCNWWGAAAGPQNASAPDPSVYTTWATEPVAGTSTTTCSGGL